MLELVQFGRGLFLSASMKRCIALLMILTKAKVKEILALGKVHVALMKGRVGD